MIKQTKYAIFFLGGLLFLAALPAIPLSSLVKGTLPDPHDIIQGVVLKYLAQCDAKEAKASFDALGDKKAILVNFLGEPGKSFLLGKCQGDACGVVKSFKPGKPAGEAEIQKVYPDILLTILAPLSVEKFNNYILSTKDEIGPEAIFMGWQGLDKYFLGLEPARHEIVLKNTPTYIFLELGLRRYGELKDYTAIMYKQERLGKKLQGVETIALKYREKPKSIYMKWIDGPWKGREVLYNESLSKTDVRVRESGFLGVIPIWIDYNNPIAQRGSNHPAVEIGLKFMLELNLRDYKRSFAAGELRRKDHGIQEVDGHKVYVMENILPRDQKKGYYCYRVFQYMDYLYSLEPRIDVYNWDDELQESFTYTKLKIDAGLTEKDFDPKNPEYRL
jgi:hypothetical protein